MEIAENSTYQSFYTKLASALQFDEKSKVEVKITRLMVTRETLGL